MYHENNEITAATKLINVGFINLCYRSEFGEVHYKINIILLYCYTLMTQHNIHQTRI